MRIAHIIIVFALFIIAACKKNDDPNSAVSHGNLVFRFEHFENGAELAFDTMKYANAAGNIYEVTEIQWFVSDITLVSKAGNEFVLEGDKFAHYIDTNIPETSTWVVADPIPVDEYKSIKLTFGIKGEKNAPYMFTDPPESDMLWPVNLGGDQGGYHYMKLNGFWTNKEKQREPFNFHLGVGQERDTDNNITGFIQNWFEIELPSSSFSLEADETKSITIYMNVENWWKDPNVYDHGVHGGKIMQNQQAMQMAAENGKNVFSVGQIETNEK